MNTLLIAPPIGSYRAIPQTAAPGYSQQLDPALVERMRRQGRWPTPKPPSAAMRLAIPHELVDGLRRCPGHGVTTEPRCPANCSRSFLEPVYADDPDVQQFLRAREEQARQPRRSADQNARAPQLEIKLGSGQAILQRPRDQQGRFLKDPEQTRPEPHPDEGMSATEVRAKLLRVLSHLPKGSKKPFARLCGYQGQWALHSLRGVAKGRGMLPEAARRRVSRVLSEIFRGDWALVETGRLPTAGRPSHAWRKAATLPAHHRRIPFKP